jgi:CcmD family protein
MTTTTNALKFLYAAYIATWAIHAFYIATLVRRFSRLRREMKELNTGE